MAKHEAPDEHPVRDALGRLFGSGGSVLHEDDPDGAVTVNGQVVRNLTAKEYAATYADGEPHYLPPEVLAALPNDDQEGAP